MPFSPFPGLISVPSITVCAYKNKNKQFVFSLSSLPVPMCLMPSPPLRAHSLGKEAGVLLETAQMKKRAVLFHPFQNPMFGAAATCHTHLTGATAPGQQFHQLGIDILGTIVVLGRCQEHP